MIKAYAAIALAVALLFGWQGYRMGVSIERGRHDAALVKAQAEAFQAAELASRKEADRLAMEAERDALARELEDAAYADPDDSCTLPAGRVLRLQQR